MRDCGLQKESGHRDVTVDGPPAPLVWSGLAEAYVEIDRVSGHFDGFWYLLSPYTKYPGGVSAAWQITVRVASSLQASGLIVFSPIVHYHPLARVAKGNIPLDNAYWLNVNRKFMDPAIGGILAELPGWQDSEGIALEVDYLQSAGKPIVHLPLPRELLDLNVMT